MSDTIPDAIAARAEAARIAEHQAALESLRQFGEPLAAPDPVIVIDMRLHAMVEVYDREWEEFDVEASVAFAASAARLRDAREVSVRLVEAEMPATDAPVTDDPRSPWQIAEGRYGLPQEFRIGQRVRFRQSRTMPDWASDWAGIDLVITGAFSTKHGAVEYWVNEVGSRDGATTDVKEEWLEGVTNG